MYYPYFRGKQFELLAIRESANLIKEARFVPIIEPVRASPTNLIRALDSLAIEGANAIVVVNPSCGDYSENSGDISDLLQQRYCGLDSIGVGVILTPEMRIEQVDAILDNFKNRNVTLIHAGFTGSRVLSEKLANDSLHCGNIFLEDQTNHLYRRYFDGKPRILVGDGFVQMKNADYPPVDSFSDLHITFEEQNMDGYGDFLTVGNNFSAGGGPAYAVAIHMTFIDPDEDDAMFIYHFKSDTNDTPTDPAGKFSQALDKLIEKLNSGSSHLLETSAVLEFRSLHETGHFPGLGYIKKLSIKHHLETLAAYRNSVSHV